MLGGVFRPATDPHLPEDWQVRGESTHLLLAQQPPPLFHVCALDFDPSEMSSDHAFCDINVSIFALSW